MKKYITMAAALLLLAGCVDFDDATQAVSVKFQIVSPEGFEGLNVEGKTVTMTLGNQTVSALTGADGIVTFTGIVPDNYDVSTTWKLSADDYATAAGIDTESIKLNKYTVSGSLNTLAVTGSDSSPILLPVSILQDRSLLIGKIYYEGSKDVNNRNYVAGKYIELYNNSAETVNAAGLYIALMETESTIAYKPGQVPDTIFAKQVFRIPTDNDVNIKSGGTLLLVNSAIDHTLTAQNAYEKNLLDADFEAKDQQGRTTNNPSTPALKLIYSTYSSMSQMNIVQGGPMSVVIFETDADVAAWPRVYAYGKTKGNMFMKIPANVVIDGVEILKNKSQTGPDINTKRLYDYIDAGYTYCSSSSGYSGEVVYRKTESTDTDGRRILQDTNNSLNDFAVSAINDSHSTTLNPREYE